MMQHLHLCSELLGSSGCKCKNHHILQSNTEECCPICPNHQDRRRKRNLPNLYGLSFFAPWDFPSRWIVLKAAATDMWLKWGTTSAEPENLSVHLRELCAHKPMSLTWHKLNCCNCPLSASQGTAEWGELRGWWLSLEKHMGRPRDREQPWFCPALNLLSFCSVSWTAPCSWLWPLASTHWFTHQLSNVCLRDPHHQIWQSPSRWLLL